MQRSRPALQGEQMSCRLKLFLRVEFASTLENDKGKKKMEPEGTVPAASGCASLSRSLWECVFSLVGGKQSQLTCLPLGVVRKFYKWYMNWHVYSDGYVLILCASGNYIVIVFPCWSLSPSSASFYLKSHILT